MRSWINIALILVLVFSIGCGKVFQKATKDDSNSTPIVISTNLTPPSSFSTLGDPKVATMNITGINSSFLLIVNEDKNVYDSLPGSIGLISTDLGDNVVGLAEQKDQVGFKSRMSCITGDCSKLNTLKNKKNRNLNLLSLPPNLKSFYISPSSSNNYNSQGILEYNKSPVIIYREVGVNFSSSLITEVGDQLNSYYADIINIYGKPSDLDLNGSIIIYLGNLNKTGVTGLAGFVSTSDLLNNNEEVLYANGFDGNNKDLSAKEIVKTIIHEFNHLIVLNKRLIEKGIEENIDIWISEGIAEHSIDVVMKEPLDGHYNSISENHSFFIWKSEAIQYHLAYLFFKYLSIHYLDDKSIQDIYLNVKSNYLAIEEALQQKYPSLSFDDLYRDFLITNYIQNVSGKYSYNGVFKKREITKMANVIDNLGLSSGERFIINLNKTQLDKFQPQKTSATMAFYKIFN
ncbi:hypothetical protein DID75_00910 [Candidatus Marinamargulisbacteria bacterium SCGC AG-410-N11]|nr:hypothetical protein DID75_00910 [Candidatus Marinamargulisbacteria bacterium SCGC AG-410-N11]